MTPYRTLGATSTSVVWRWTDVTPDAAAQARLALRCALVQVGFDLDGEKAGDVVTAVSEFVANAVEHAVGPYEMRLRCIGPELICEVEDRDPCIPSFPSGTAAGPRCGTESCAGDLDLLYSLLSEGGRGLQIVDKLTGGAWGFRGWTDGKVAWLTLPAPRRDLGLRTLTRKVKRS